MDTTVPRKLYLHKVIVWWPWLVVFPLAVIAVSVHLSVLTRLEVHSVLIIDLICHPLRNLFFQRIF